MNLFDLFRSKTEQHIKTGIITPANIDSPASTMPSEATAAIDSRNVPSPATPLATPAPAMTTPLSTAPAAPAATAFSTATPEKVASEPQPDSSTDKPSDSLPTQQ